MKRRSKVLEIVKREPNGISVHFSVIQLLGESNVCCTECNSLSAYIVDLKGALHRYSGST